LGDHCATTPGPLAGLVPFAPFITIIGHKRGVGCVGVLGTWKRKRKREIGVVKEGKKTFFPCLQPTSRERRWYTISSKRRRLVLPLLFLITINKTTLFCIKRVVSLNGTTPKKSIFPNQSSIFYLFN